MAKRKRSEKRRNSDDFRERYGPRKKSLKNRSGKSGLKYEEKRSIAEYEERGAVPITPQMIRLAVKELHTKRVFVSSALIASHLRRCYPIESDPSVLKRELEAKLDVAVCVGLIAKCGDDAYCLPTLRQQATNRKTDFSSFWERYNKRGPQSRRTNCLENPRRRLKKPLQRDLTDYLDDNDDDAADIP